MIFLLFWGMVMYANIVETEEKKLPEIKINRWRWCGFLPLCCNNNNNNNDNTVKTHE